VTERYRSVAAGRIEILSALGIDQEVSLTANKALVQMKAFKQVAHVWVHELGIVTSGRVEAVGHLVATFPSIELSDLEQPALVLCDLLMSHDGDPRSDPADALE
jgi:hypothetical protein